MGSFNQKWALIIAGCLLVSTVCLIIGTAGTHSGWFHSSLDVTPTSSRSVIDHPLLAGVVPRDTSIKVDLDFGTLGLTATIPLPGVAPIYTSYSDMEDSDGLDAVRSAAAASLAFCILAWVACLVGIALFALDRFGVLPLHSFAAVGAVGVVFIFSLIAWTVFLGVIKNQWSHSSGLYQYPLNPSWAWAFALIGWLAALAAAVATFFAVRASGDTQAPEGFERV